MKKIATIPEPLQNGQPSEAAASPEQLNELFGLTATATEHKATDLEGLVKKATDILKKTGAVSVLNGGVDEGVCIAMCRWPGLKEFPKGTYAVNAGYIPDDDVDQGVPLQKALETLSSALEGQIENLIEDGREEDIADYDVSDDISLYNAFKHFDNVDFIDPKNVPGRLVFDSLSAALKDKFPGSETDNLDYYQGVYFYRDGNTNGEEVVIPAGSLAPGKTVKVALGDIAFSYSFDKEGKLKIVWAK